MASIHSSGSTGESPGEYARAFARLENHYFINNAFLEKDGQILRQMDKIAHIPGHIVQGRYDMICPPQAAWSLSERWPNAELKMVRNAGPRIVRTGNQCRAGANHGPRGRGGRMTRIDRRALFASGAAAALAGSDGRVAGRHAKNRRHAALGGSAG